MWAGMGLRSECPLQHEASPSRLTSISLLTACTCQLAYGRLYQIFAIKWAFLSAIIIFEIGSLVAALAPASNVLIVGRAVSGLGFAGIGTGSLM